MIDLPDAAATDLPDWAAALDLQPHPEGGWFRETWRSELTLGTDAVSYTHLTLPTICSV